MSFPTSPIVAGEVVIASCAAWRDVLHRAAGVTCTTALVVDDAPPPAAAAPFYIYSDAAKDGTAAPSLGGGGGRVSAPSASLQTFESRVF